MKRVDQIVLDGPSRHLSNISQVHARLAVGCHYLGDAKEADRRLQQSEFNASQIRNDFDLVDALRTLSSCYLMRGELDKAKEIATRGLSTSLRHTATYPVLTLLMVLVETAVAEGHHEAAEFYLHEADLLVESGMLVPNRDMVIYHYYRARSSENDERREFHRSAGASALRHELDAIDDDRLTEVFLTIRNFERIHRDLLGGAAAADSA